MVIDFPDWVRVTHCTTASTTKLKRTTHGIVKTVRKGRVTK
jgi:hypothetical protein